MFDTIFSFVKGMEYEGYFTVEATAFRPDGTVDVDMLNRCFERIIGRRGL